MKHDPKNLIRFKDHATAQPNRVEPGSESALVIILPTVKIERFVEPSTTDLPFLPPAKRERRGVAARRMRAKLEKQAQTVESCLMWLGQIARDGADHRALVSLLTQSPGTRYLDADFRASAAWLTRFAEAWERQRMLDSRIRTIDEDSSA